MIPTIQRTHYKPEMIKSQIRRNIRRIKHNILPITLPRTSRDIMMLLRLSRCLQNMKYHLIRRINNLIRNINNIPLHYMRKNYIKPINIISHTHTKLSGMTTKLPTSKAHLLRTTNHLNN